MTGDVLAGWVAEPFRAGAVTHEVYRRGDGPGVVLLPELPGATPEVMTLANHLVESGFAVVVPSLTGTAGRPASLPYTVRTVARVCVSSEFAAFARGADRPVAAFVRALARDQHWRSGGPGVGVIGMCFTGGFALAAAVEPAVLAPVGSQPSAPFPVGRRRRRDIGMSPGEAEVVSGRIRTEGLCLLGLRFSADKVSRAERFAALQERFGDGFRVIEIDSSKGNPHGIPRGAHSVICSDLVDEPGHPTLEARADVVAFLRERLG